MDNETLIAAYLDDELSPAERAELEARLPREADLQAELSLQRETRQLLHLNRRAALKQQLQAVAAERQAARVRPLRWLRWQAVAAAVLLLVGLASLLWPGGSAFEQAFEPYPDRLTLRQEAAGTAYQSAMAAYQAGDYAQAAEQWRQLNQQQPGNQAWYFYQGVAELGADQPQAAAATLERVSASSLYHLQAQWYLALAYGEAKEINKARTLLRSMAEQAGHPYQEAAAEILADMGD